MGMVGHSLAYVVDRRFLGRKHFSFFLGNEVGEMNHVRGIEWEKMNDVGVTLIASQQAMNE